MSEQITMAPAASSLETPPAEIPEAELRALAALKLPDEDGVPLENAWHRLQINLLEDCIRQHWQGRTDFYVGGNMFLYYSLEQAFTRDYKGPDLFVVTEVDGTRPRPYWAVWQEGGRTPELVVELLSESTRREDLGSKKALYERVLHVLEYVCYGPDPTQSESVEFYMWRLSGRHYREVSPDAHRRVWSEVLGAYLGTWEGEYNGMRTRWLRLFDADGNLIPTAQERALAAEARAQLAEERALAAEERALAAEQRAERLAAQLRAMGIEPEA